ncbi:MAG: NUDIX domain-containing protein [Pirellulaceae bacterium]
MDRQSHQLDSGLPVQQVGVVPFRIVQQQIQFCLITGRRSGRWRYPKGHVKPYETPQDAAIAEALEEAGIRGELGNAPLKTLHFVKGGRPYSLTMYLMHVEAIRLKWKESKERFRIWASVENALELIDCPDLKQLALDATAHIDESNVGIDIFPLVKRSLNTPIWTAKTKP